MRGRGHPRQRGVKTRVINRLAPRDPACKGVAHRGSKGGSGGSESGRGWQGASERQSLLVGRGGSSTPEQSRESPGRAEAAGVPASAQQYCQQAWCLARATQCPLPGPLPQPSPSTQAAPTRAHRGAWGHWLAPGCWCWQRVWEAGDGHCVWGLQAADPCAGTAH